MSTLKVQHVFRRLIQTSAPKRCQQCPTSSGVEPPEPEGGYKIFKRLALFVALPVIVGLSVMIFLKKKACEEEREPFHKYPHLRIHTKDFPWGDGQKSLFHNPKYNPLPDGYEDEIDNEACKK